MFTGIIAAVGEIADKRMIGGDLRLYVRTGKLDLADVKLGDSIATNGVCLTVVELPGDGFIADLSLQTLAHSRFEEMEPGTAVNLEKALRPSERLGGHLVTGHVDAVGTVVERTDAARAVAIRVRMPPSIQRYVAPKGSITVDGVSLTVNRLEGIASGSPSCRTRHGKPLSTATTPVVGSTWRWTSSLAIWNACSEPTLHGMKREQRAA